MTKSDAKKRLLGFLVNVLTTDDEAPFGEEIAYDTESQAYRAMDAARKELVAEFNKRGAL